VRRGLLALLAVVVAACSSSGEDAAPATTATPTTAKSTTTTAPEPTTTARVPAVPANDPVALAEQIVEAEGAIGDPATSLLEMPALGHAQQVAYRTLAVHPEWQADVYARLPAGVLPIAQAHVNAAVSLRSLLTNLKDAPPTDWRIVEPPAPDQLLSFYMDAERRTGIGWYYLAAVHLVESRMGRLRGTSTAGAKGPMQFIDSTWARYAVDANGDGVANVEDPHDAILAAANYLKVAGGPGNMRRALFAYNHADAYVDAVDTYARHMQADARRYHAYYGWQVYYLTTQGDVLLPVGYGA
jgi:soluble lytic murein transglycosylase-like protein